MPAQGQGLLKQCRSETLYEESSMAQETAGLPAETTHTTGVATALDAAAHYRDWRPALRAATRAWPGRRTQARAMMRIIRSTLW